MATEIATDRSGGGGIGEGGEGLLPGIDKNDDDLNMNARERATNRAKTTANAMTKTGASGKGGELDANLGWATNFLTGWRFDVYVDLEGGSAEKFSWSIQTSI